MTTARKCRECGGKGGFWVDAAPGSTARFNDDPDWEDCRRCSGTGFEETITDRQAFLLLPHGDRRAVSPQNGRGFQLAELQQLVGGYVQVIYLADGRLMLLDEDGKSKEQAINSQATDLLRQAGGIPGDLVVGSVLISPPEMVE